MSSASSASSSVAPTHVVTCFLLQRSPGGDLVLLVRRSERVRTYRGAWAGVSGYLEQGVTPLEQAYTEIREETGLDRDGVRLLNEGMPLPVEDREQGLSWVVHPFLFVLDDPTAIRTDWEATDHTWVRPADLASYSAVPMLAEAFAHVYPAPEAANAAP